MVARTVTRPLFLEGTGGPGARADRVARRVFLACAALTGGTAAVVLGVLAVGAAQFFAEAPAGGFFAGTTWAPFAEEPRFGVWPLVAATSRITIGAILVAAPLGLLSAVYLQHYAGRRTGAVVAAAVAALASVPTVVFGYVALNAATPLLRLVWPGAEAFNGASATLVVGLMIAPTVAFLGREALAAVPPAYFHAGMALGASRGRVVALVVAPAAARGIAAAVLLAMARAVGETMIVTMAAGSHAGLAWSPLEGVRTLTAFVAQTSLGDIAPDGPDFRAVAAVAALLFVVTYAMHAAGRALLARRPAGSAHP